jgi:hypothetical protein
VQVRRKDWRGFQGLLPSAQRDPVRDARTPALATWASGDFDLPVVAWIEATAGGEASLYVSKWDGASWIAVGGDLGMGAPAAPAIAVDGGAATWLAWTEAPAGGSATLLARRTEGDAFGPPGAMLNADPARGAAAPSLAIDPSGRPALAWSEGTGPDETLVLRRWDGNGWSPAALLPGGGSPVLAFDGVGRAVVAYVETATGQVHVARHDGTVWRDVGAPVGGQAVRPGTAPRIAIDEAGTAHVLFTDDTGALHLLFENR